MATSDVELANGAIGRLGGDRITAFIDDTKEARLATLFYEDTIDEVLEMHDWNFAVVRVRLAQLSTAPAFGYDYQYTLPVDPFCLRVVEAVVDGGTEITDYVIEGRNLLTDAATCNIKYISRYRTVGSMSLTFQQCVQARLAHKMSYDLTPKVSVRNSLLQEFGLMLSEAQSNDQAGGSAPDVPVEASDTDLIADRSS